MRPRVVLRIMPTMLIPTMTALALATAPVAAQEGQFSGEIEVDRVLTEVRVVLDDGSPVLGLEAADFAVSIGGVPVTVESADWIGSPPISLDDARAASASSTGQIRSSRAADRGGGRTVILLLQIGFEDVRLTGLYRMAAQATRLVRGLDPADRVALAVYDRHLTLHSDLTSDLEHIASLLRVPELVRWDNDLERRSEPSLVDSFNVDAAEDAATMQQGLKVLAAALEPLPGPKTIVFLGWGIGRFGSSGVVLGSAYGEATLSLARARATVYSLDITNADLHTLEVGLQAVARDTGGFYVKTHLFPELAIRRLARVMSGHYELSLIPPPEIEGYAPLEATVRLPGRRATVLARPVVRLGTPEASTFDRANTATR